ncbi:MAG: hypothetical protein ACRDZ4_04675 [Egibacteraceae bacterium]
MIYEYSDKIELSDDTTLGTRDYVLDRTREVGEASEDGRCVGFTFTADDLWDLHELVSDLAEDLRCFGIDLAIEKSKATVVVDMRRTAR